MELLIKYRNDRKNEGASAGELNGLDGRIHALLDKSVDQIESSLDVELLRYRKSLVEAGLPFGRIDKHIFHVLGSRPANVVDVIVCTLGPTKKETAVSVDLANETVGNLMTKAAAVVGTAGLERIRLILNGKHLERTEELLSSTHVAAGSKVFVCFKLGCNGNCCEMGYSMLCDAMLRDAVRLKDVPEDKLHRLFMVTAATAAAVPRKEVMAIMRPSEDEAMRKLCALLSAKDEILCSRFSSPTLLATPPNAISMEPTISTKKMLPESDDEDLYG